MCPRREAPLRRRTNYIATISDRTLDGHSVTARVLTVRGRCPEPRPDLFGSNYCLARGETVSAGPGLANLSKHPCSSAGSRIGLEQSARPHRLDNETRRVALSPLVEARA